MKLGRQQINFRLEAPGNAVWAAASIAMPIADPNWDVMLRIGPKLKTPRSYSREIVKKGAKPRKA